MAENPKVFISYAHQDAEYGNRILDFANKLRSEGIDANIDLYEESPKEGWPRWMENQIKDSDYVLVCCSKTYYDNFYSADKGKGVKWEVNIIYQYLYEANTETQKFIPIFLDESEKQYIPTPIKSFTYYNAGANDDYEKLYWRLRGVTKTQKPPLGKLKPLPEKKQKVMFVSSPIDVDKWNAAGWTGALYMFYPTSDHPPVLGILFKEYLPAKAIFSEWNETANGKYADDFLRVDFIVPPFPNNCWVNSEKDHHLGIGYFIHIGPNIEQSIQRGIDSGIKPEEILLTTISRYQWMGELNGSQNRDIFKKMIENGSPYFLMPIGIKNIKKPMTEDNLIIDFNYAIKMKKVYFTAGKDVTDQDIYNIVLKKPSER